MARRRSFRFTSGTVRALLDSFGLFIFGYPSLG
jgi:hypothetical protein